MRGPIGMGLVALCLKTRSLEGTSTKPSPQDVQSITWCGSGCSNKAQLMLVLSQDGTQTTLESAFILDVFGASLAIPGFGNVASSQGG